MQNITSKVAIVDSNIMSFKVYRFKKMNKKWLKELETSSLVVPLKE